MNVDLMFRNKADWDYMDKSGQKYRVIAIFEQDSPQPIALVDINTKVIGAPEWQADRAIKSLDNAYMHEDGSFEIEYTTLYGKSYAEKLPPLSKLSILKDNKYVPVKADKEYVA